MNFKKITASIMVLIMAMLIAFTGCGKETDNITVVSKETALKVTADMTRKQLYKLFGNTYGQQLSGQDGFLATYIVENRYIYSISVYNDDENDTALGYDGQALMNSLETNSRSLTTSRGMTVRAEKDLDTSTGSNEFLINVKYNGKFSVSMDGYNIRVNNKLINDKSKLTGSVNLLVDVANPVSSEPVKTETTVAAETTAAVKTTVKGETTAVNETTSAETTAAETTVTEVSTTAAPANNSENRLIGMLEITNDADETVYVEIYAVGSSLYICRVR